MSCPQKSRVRGLEGSSVTITAILKRAETGARLSAAEALALAAFDDLGALTPVAAALRDAGHGNLVSYSRKVSTPLTALCRDVCQYCTFAHPPRRGEAAYLDREQVLAIARAGAKAGCKEALFTLGDKPELRYAAARDALARLGHDTTLSYLAEMAGLVLRETGLLPHLNPGVMTRADIDRLRQVSVSQGIMLESAAERLRRRGGPHFGSPDKDPALRLETIRAAGEAAVPFTSGILIGTGAAGKLLVERLAIYPAYARDPTRWLDAPLRTPVLQATDAAGFARTDDWVPGAGSAPPPAPHPDPLPASGAREKSAKNPSPC